MANIYSSFSSFLSSIQNNAQLYINTDIEGINFEHYGLETRTSLDHTIVSTNSGTSIITGNDDDNRLVGDQTSTTIIIQKEFNDTLLSSLKERTNIFKDQNPAEDSLGVFRENFTLDHAATATLTFRPAGAGYRNTLGIYKINNDGTISDAKILFTNVKHAQIGELYDIDLPVDQEGGTFGFFIISNGANKNNFSNLPQITGEGVLEFVYQYDKKGERTAETSDTKDISLIYNDGEITHILSGDIFHTDFRDDHKDHKLNTDNKEHVVSGLVDIDNTETLRIGFEDLTNLGDKDYEDVLFDFSINALEFTIIEHIESGDDILNGGAGNDTLIGGKGDDDLNGGDGFDTADYADNQTAIHADAHTGTVDDDNDGMIDDTLDSIESIIGSNHNDYLRAHNKYGMKLYGGQGDDYIQGQAQADELYGEQDNDYILGFGGNDLIYGGAGNDTALGGSGSDTLYGDAGDDILKGREDNDSLYGGEGDDILLGNGNHDYIQGDAGNDLMRGGGGDDILFSNGGRDILFGDLGADIFLFENETAFNDLAIIKDFDTNEGDQIDISALLSNYSDLDHAITDFVRFTESNGNSYLRVDSDGKFTNGGDYQIVARIDGHTGLDAEALETNGSLIV